MSRILRETEVRKRLGFSHSTIWRRRRAGTFPEPVDLGGGMLGWTEESIDEYIKSLPKINIKVIGGILLFLFLVMPLATA